MVILPGKRLGPYEILSAIGAGGMGEVYRAKDTRLDRIVAIKVLPSHLADSPELRERFEREARTIASLNHPHICTLYDIGHQDGTDFLVMEYLEGETLAQRLVKGPLPLDQVLQYAIEIADALDKAHRKGMTHRDLKPGNIMLTKSGTKLLDFGLAKLKQEVAPANVQLSQLPTANEPLTAQGTIVGTLQYMAPEQLEGKEVDARTDIFAFGAVVYEMATGRRAFEGKSQASLIAKILETDPPPISSLQPMTPPALDRVVKRCLAKDPDDRWQTARDMEIELKWIVEGGSEVGLAGPTVERPKSRERMLAATAAVAVIALIALSVPAIERLRETPPPETRTEIVTPSTTDPISFALSPDGRQIAFVASGDGPSRLWLRRLDTTAAQPLAGTEGASFPFWSPDSRSVAFLADGKLKRVDIGGGSPETLTNALYVRRGTWGPDGTILFEAGDAGVLFRVSASGGEPTVVTKLEKEPSLQRFPQFLPDGRQFIFSATGAPGRAGIYLGSLDSPEVKRVTAADSNGEYLPTGWLLFIRAGTLLAQRLDPTSKELTGNPIIVADSVAIDANTYGGAFSVSASGLLAYRPRGAGPHQLIWFDRSGKMLSTVGDPDSNGLSRPYISPDGRRVAAFRTVQGKTDVWLLDASRSTRFTFDPSANRSPVWSPDGSQIAFDSTRKGRRDLYVKPSNGAGNEQLLVESEEDKFATDWSRDGRFLLYGSGSPQTSFDIWVVPMEGEHKPFVFLKTNFDERQAMFSPDGHWVAFVSNQSGRYEIYVQPFSAGSPGTVGGQWQVSTTGGMYPRWRSDGRELYYIAPDGKLMAAPVTFSGTSFRPGTPVALFQTRIYGGGTDMNVGHQYDVSSDGRFLINTVLEDATSPITLLQNWSPGAKK